MTQSCVNLLVFLLLNLLGQQYDKKTLAYIGMMDS